MREANDLRQAVGGVLDELVPAGRWPASSEEAMHLSLHLQREIARVHFSDPTLNRAALARRVGVAHATVKKLLWRLEVLGANWEELQSLDDAAWQAKISSPKHAEIRAKWLLAQQVDGPEPATITHRVAGAIATWKDNSPLKWEFREKSKGSKAATAENFDLTPLEEFCTREFLLELKHVLLLSRHRQQIPTIKHQVWHIASVIKRVAASSTFSGCQINVIDAEFVASFKALGKDIPRPTISFFLSFFKKWRENSIIFKKELREVDFPTANKKYGSHSERIKSIIAKAKPRATLVNALDHAERAYELNHIDIGRYSSLCLAVSTFCRPKSYSSLTLADLMIDTDPATGTTNYFLDVTPAKSRVHNPKKILYRLHSDVGQVLAMQRMSVTENYGHLAPRIDGVPQYGTLALFPSHRLKADGSAWVSDYSNARGGELPKGAFHATYLTPVNAITGITLTANSLRHTVGTQLAMMGCSSATIQGVLKHASSNTCNAYVDIAFSGLIDSLSDSLEPAFRKNYPTFKKFSIETSEIPTERRIDVDSLDASQRTTAGLCGRTVACDYAPMACYPCPRFIPFYDVDHSPVLEIVDEEIAQAQGHGLAMQHDIDRWKTIRRHIQHVISFCEALRQLDEGNEEGSGSFR